MQAASRTNVEQTKDFVALNNMLQHFSKTKYKKGKDAQKAWLKHTKY